MRSGEDAVEVTLLQAALLAGLLELGRATGDVSGLDTASLELVGAVGERSTLDGLKEVAALSGLLGDVVAGVGNGNSAQESKAGDGIVGETHVDCEKPKVLRDLERLEARLDK